MRTLRRMISLSAMLGPLFVPCSPAFARAGESEKAEERPNFVRLENSLTVVSPRGDQVATLNGLTGKTSVVRLAETTSDPLQVDLIVGPGVIATSIRGTKITRIAASNTKDGQLITQTLVQPVDGLASPIVGPGIAAYVIGHHAYAFSPTVNRWGVVPLSEGHVRYAEVCSGHATVYAPGHVYTFSCATGKWDHLDLKKIFGSADAAGPPK